MAFWNSILYYTTPILDEAACPVGSPTGQVGSALLEDIGPCSSCQRIAGVITSPKPLLRRIGGFWGKQVLTSRNRHESYLPKGEVR